MKIITLEQGSEQWHDFRRTHIGASDLPAIMGVSKWKTQYELWREKLGFGVTKDSWAMAYGREKEPEIRARVEEMLNLTFAPVVVTHDKYSWASASLDGWNADHWLPLEIKCASAADHAVARDGKIPMHYAPQVQWQMFVTGAKALQYASYHDGEVVLVHVERDDDYIRDMLVAAQEFHACVVSLREPEMTERDYVPIEADARFLELAEEYRMIEHKLEHYSPLLKRKDELKKELCEYTDDGNCEGGGIRFLRVQRKGSIDWNRWYKDALAQIPELADMAEPAQYTKDSIGYWKLSVEDDE